MLMLFVLKSGLEMDIGAGRCCLFSYSKKAVPLHAMEAHGEGGGGGEGIAPTHT
jgi:hypothetical protein